MDILFQVSLIISVILTTGVYLTGYIDQRQFEKFGFIGAQISHNIVYVYLWIYKYSYIVEFILKNYYL